MRKYRLMARSSNKKYDRIRGNQNDPPRERSFQTGTGEGALLLRIIGMKKGEENKNFELIYFLLNQTFRAS